MRPKKIRANGILLMARGEEYPAAVTRYQPSTIRSSSEGHLSTRFFGLSTARRQQPFHGMERAVSTSATTEDLSMMHLIVPDSRFLSRLALLLLLASPTAPALAAVEESRSTLHTYTPAIRNDPSPFHCTDCWDLTPDQRPALPHHPTQPYLRGHHDRGLPPHKNPFA